MPSIPRSANNRRPALIDSRIFDDIIEEVATVSPVVAPAAPITFVCAETGQTCPIIDKITVIKDGDQINISRQHLHHYRYCSECDGYFHQDDEYHTVNDNIICEYCFNDEFFICEACDNPFRNDCYGNDGQCRNCLQVNAFDTIQEYNTKAPANFATKKKILGYTLDNDRERLIIKKNQDITRYFGIEIEVECGDDNKNQAAKEVRKLLGEHIITKNDGSLHNGFEIVTVPATIDIHKEKFASFFEKRPKCLRAFDTETCGLHIHVSRKSLTHLQIGKILVFLNSTRNRSFVEILSQREMGSYCARKNKNLKDVLPKYRSGDRREALNLTNKDTIEFRVFRSTLYAPSFYKSLEFCDALISFCDIGHSIVESAKQDNFIKFVQENYELYPHLNAFIQVKFLEKDWISKDGKVNLGNKHGFKLNEADK